MGKGTHILQFAVICWCLGHFGQKGSMTYAFPPQKIRKNFACSDTILEKEQYDVLFLICKIARTTTFFLLLCDIFACLHTIFENSSKTTF